MLDAAHPSRLEAALAGLLEELSPPARVGGSWAREPGASRPEPSHPASVVGRPR